LIFPKWTNFLPLVLVVVLGLGLTTVIFVFSYWFTDKHLVVGYQPLQPIAFSHKIHNVDLGIDCRYCHFSVERSSVSSIPPSATCMNCHNQVRTDRPEIKKLKAYHESGNPIPWVRVHRLPEYVSFDHSVHVKKGVSCAECHGRVDQMAEVRHDQDLSMAWCLDCHRNPDSKLRPQSQITNMSWTLSPQERATLGAQLRKENFVHPRTDCSACHR